MKEKKKNRKLLFQIGVVLIPVFLGLMAGILWVIYDSSVDGYLEAQNTHMEIFLNQVYAGCILADYADQDMEDVKEWAFKRLASDPEAAAEAITQEENDAAFKDLMDDKVSQVWTLSWLENSSDAVQRYAIKTIYEETQTHFQNDYIDQKYDDLFVVDLTDEHKGLVLYESLRKDGTRHVGDHYDLNASNHSAIEKLLESGKDEIVFERSDDIPAKGSYYIGYKPIYLNGKLYAAIGLVYNWKGIHDAVISTMNKAWLLGIGGFVLAMGIILAVLYRKSIRPLTRIQGIVREYTKDKNAEETLSRTAEINDRNEFGLLSDDIAGMVTEIDHYTKENIRLAGEKERTEKELYEAQVSVMVSQIQPHFMYNALTSIAMMCTIDPDVAQEATVTFADYLRGNMDSLKQKEPVPFEIELEHLKKYIYIEQLRFGKKLNIEYDIQTTTFKLPLLSIQPLVENAVKHGVGMKKEGGTVTIATRETDTTYEVIVSDDGVGFDAEEVKNRQKSKSDGRSHVGMENIKKRLHDQCGADVVIKSVVGEGTTAKVIIPKVTDSKDTDPNETGSK